MLKPSRRTVVAGGATLAAGATLPRSADAASSTAIVQAESDLRRYIGFGSKRAGGAGDNACGAWMASELQQLGFTIERQEVSTPFFEPARAELTCGVATAPVWPQPIVVPTDPQGVSGRLVYVDPRGRPHGDLAGAIAVVDLPTARWSTALAKPIREPVTAAFMAGAVAVVVVTNGPTGKVIALNADGRKPMFTGPVALLAPEAALPFLTAAAEGERATLFIEGRGGRRPAFNFVARLDRRRGRWLAVSTPRSGWFTCAGERGPGVAVWLALARWAVRNLPDHDLAFVCNSGHEYEYLGAAEALKAIAPKPSVTKLWLHLGANVAARDWHEGTGKPLPSTDPERYLAMSPSLIPIARSVFAGEVGLEAPYSSDVLAAGELTEVIAAGFKPAAGVFGIHRYHHIAGDDERCVSGSAIASATGAFVEFVKRALAA